MTEIAQATHNIDDFNAIMETLYKRVRRGRADARACHALGGGGT